MALSFLAIQLTHLMPRLAEDYPWTWWFWAIVLAFVTTMACIDVVLQRRRDRRSS